jgi:hypothetical protein
MKLVLEEQGFNVSQLRAKCSPVCPIKNQNCCMARLLSQQEDFAHQVSMLETLITEAGHLCIFLPKFHFELNPIEMVCYFYHKLGWMLILMLQYWGWAKYRYREASKASFAEAKRAAQLYLNACPVNVIRRFINRSWQFMSAY